MGVWYVCMLNVCVYVCVVSVYTCVCAFGVGRAGFPTPGQSNSPFSLSRLDSPTNLPKCSTVHKHTKIENHPTSLGTTCRDTVHILVPAGHVRSCGDEVSNP